MDTQFKSASIYAQIAADRVDNIIFENVNIYGSLNGRGTNGVEVKEMWGLQENLWASRERLRQSCSLFLIALVSSPILPEAAPPDLRLRECD